jgi:ferric-dicitrate binding protein FerR (iron transport regulator)
MPTPRKAFIERLFAHRGALQAFFDTVRALHISGVFDVYDLDSFAAFLETLHGVVVQKTPTRVRVRNIASAYREQQAVAH